MTQTLPNPAAIDTEMYGTENVDPPLTGETAWPLPPWAADTETAAREKIDPAAGRSEKADTHDAAACIETVPQRVARAALALGRDDDDTLEMPPGVAGLTGGQHLAPQPQGQRVTPDYYYYYQPKDEPERHFNPQLVDEWFLRAVPAQNSTGKKRVRSRARRRRNRRLPLKQLVPKLLVLLVFVILNVVLLELLLSRSR